MTSDEIQELVEEARELARCGDWSHNATASADRTMAAAWFWARREGARHDNPEGAARYNKSLKAKLRGAAVYALAAYIGQGDDDDR